MEIAMFRSFLYLDEVALSSYCQQLEIDKGFHAVSAKGTLGTNLPLISAGVEVEGRASSPLESVSQIALYNEFEKALVSHRNVDFFDFLTGNPDITTIPPMSLLRFSGHIRIPESFDMINALSSFAPFLLQTGRYNFDSNDIPLELVDQLLGNQNAGVPLLIEGMDIALYSIISTAWLIDCDITDFEESEGEDVIVLCKLVSHIESQAVTVYDPLKDFMKLNRMMRRSISRSEGLEAITIDGPAIKVSIVAIYN